MRPPKDPVETAALAYRALTLDQRAEFHRAIRLAGILTNGQPSRRRGRPPKGQPNGAAMPRDHAAEQEMVRMARESFPEADRIDAASRARRRRKAGANVEVQPA